MSRAPAEVDPRAVARARAALRGEEGWTRSVATDFDAVCAELSPRTVALCRRVVGDDQIARELAQEALLLAWRRLPELEDPAALPAFVFTTARQLAMNRVRLRGELLTEDGVIEVGDPAASALAGLHADERERVLLEAAATALDPLEQEAVWLRYGEGLPQERITEVLGLDSASGARGLLQRCRRKLERALRRELARIGHRSSFFRE